MPRCCSSAVQPQRFLLTSEVKCMHFHGTEVRKPIPSYQIYKGTVFELVDQAVDFVMSKIDRVASAPVRWDPQAPVDYELPREAVARPSSTPWRTATTPATPASRSCCSPTGSRSGIPANCRPR